MRYVRATIIALALGALTATAALAQQTAAADPPSRPQKGVGFQWSWPAWGLSGIYDLNPNVSAQAVLGLFGGWTTFSGRGLVRFAQRPQIDPYGYGMLGFWRYSLAGVSESALTFGGGAGVDVDLRKWAPDFPPLFLNLEIGISVVNIDIWGHNGTVLSYGSGLHYRF